MEITTTGSINMKFLQIYFTLFQGKTIHFVGTVVVAYIFHIAGWFLILWFLFTLINSIYTTRKSTANVYKKMKNIKAKQLQIPGKRCVCVSFVLIRSHSVFWYWRHSLTNFSNGIKQKNFSKIQSSIPCSFSSQQSTVVTQ